MLTNDRYMAGYTINHYTPAYDNLYSIEIHNAVTDAQTGVANSYIQYHATSVSLGEDSLNLVRNDVTKRFQIAGDGAYSRPDMCTIVWRESADWRVRKYHEEWLSMFYNKTTNQYQSAPYDGSICKDRFRNFKIKLPKNEKTLPSTFSFNDSINADKKWGTTLVLENVVPRNIGALSLQWGTNPNIISHSISYYVEDWHWEE